MENQVEEEKKSKKKKYLLLLLLLLLLFKIIFWYNYFQKPDDIYGVKEEGNNIVEANTVTDKPINNTVNNVNTVKPTNTTNNATSNTTNKVINDSTNNIVDGNVTKPEIPEGPQEPVQPQEPEEPQPEQPEEPQVKEFKVTSKGQKITGNLTIFDETKHNQKAIIYPGISNTYNFEISNTLDFNVVCEIIFEEKNIENLPIKYKLKENGKYIKGDENTYVSYNQLNFSKIVSSQEENKYELEWKWQETENDNFYGDVNKDIKYEIKLIVNANEQTEE